MVGPAEYIVDLARETLTELAAGTATAVPRLVTGLVFLTVAYVVIRVLLRVLRSALGNLYPAEQDLVAQLWVSVVGVFLWFGAALVLLKIVGLGDVAASLGTGAGFLALGVSYALSDMIEDAVAGVYLLRDPDFNPGDRVTTQSITGTVQRIELRKSRIERDDGDVVVVANRDVEPRWTREIGPD
ncbi:MAG: mechanosensitive ion channel domain-containing protein [Haloarculaceae archaeon]